MNNFETKVKLPLFKLWRVFILFIHDIHYLLQIIDCRIYIICAVSNIHNTIENVEIQNTNRNGMTANQKHMLW